MREELAKILDVSDLQVDLKRIKNINGYDIEHSVFASNDKQMKVEVWRSLGKTINFCKVVVDINGKEFNETIGSNILTPNMFLKYFKTLDELSDDQLFFVFNYVEGLMSEIEKHFYCYEQYPDSEYQLKIIPLLDEYLSFKTLIDKNNNHKRVQLFKLLSPNIERALIYFKIYLTMNHNSKLAGFYDGIFSITKG